MITTRSQINKVKPGINTFLKCKYCKKNLGYITLKQKIKWRTIRWMIGLGLLFEILANIVVFLIFR